MTDRQSRRAGRFTLPSEAGMEEVTIRLARRWGADAIRDSDGTTLSPELLKLGHTVYSTLCLVRADQAWAKAHRDHLQQKFLMSEPCAADGERLEMDLMAGFFREQHEIDANHDPHRWWDVMDRTTGERVPPDRWDFEAAKGTVVVRGTRPGHVYTVNFLVYQVWDSTSMYNHITNHWTGDHLMSVDPRHPETRRHLMEVLDRWLAERPHTRIVRLTSLAYQFAFIFGENRWVKFADGQCYTDPTSALAIEEFERAKGYRLTSEDFVDAGYYNNTCRVPSRAYLDWIDFVHDFVVGFGKECVEHIHRAGKQAMLFFCDHWIGTEPYSPRFAEMGFDAIVGPCLNGVELRKIAEVPAPIVKEVRLYPYFFPTGLSGEPMFKAGGDPVAECRRRWIKIRRAMLRRCPDRIGFGGYLSLAAKHPAFLDYVEHLADEFRAIRDGGGGTRPWASPFKVGILNAWGRLRSWMNREYAGGGLMECLAGLPFEVEFLSFRDVAERGVPQDVGVLVNTGDAGTAWSGGPHWTDERVVAAVRDWVRRGGGLVGVGEPTAYHEGGAFFQLADVLGVERDTGLRGLFNRIRVEPTAGHFILEDTGADVEFPHRAGSVYAPSPATSILAGTQGNILIAANTFGGGRAVYFAGFPFSWPMARLLDRALCWAAGREDQLACWRTANLLTECAAYPATGRFVVINNDAAEQRTAVRAADDRTIEVALGPFESRWFAMDSGG